MEHASRVASNGRLTSMSSLSMSLYDGDGVDDDDIDFQ